MATYTQDGREVRMADERSLELARTIARLMDSAVTVPGTRITLGLDVVLGLIPGVGDALGALISSQLILTAARHGAPVHVLARMLGNLAVDAAVGAIPLLGDLFDVAFRANRRNLALLERHVGGSSLPPGRAHRRLVGAAVAIGAVAVLIAISAGVIAWQLVETVAVAVG